MARIAPDQLLILLDHIRCAAFELPFASGERFGENVVDDFLEVLSESEVLHREGERWDWIADSYPAQAVSLRSVSDGNFVVIDRTGGSQTIIAEVDYSSAALTLYEGAIYMVQSSPYQVESLDWAGRKQVTDMKPGAPSKTVRQVAKTRIPTKWGVFQAGRFERDIANGRGADGRRDCSRRGRPLRSECQSSVAAFAFLSV